LFGGSGFEAALGLADGLEWWLLEMRRIELRDFKGLVTSSVFATVYRGWRGKDTSACVAVLY